MKSSTWLLNRHVMAALCATPLLIGSAAVMADEMAPAADAAPAAAVAAEPAEPAPPYTLTFNLGVVTNYISRGVNYSAGPAIQGGVDWAHSSGFFLGAWASSANPQSLGAAGSFTNLYANTTQPLTSRGNHVETDWYGGYAHAFGPVTVGAGGLFVWYPENELSYHNRNQNNFEGNINVSAYGFTYTFSHAFTDWYGIGNTRRDAPGLPTPANASASTKGVEYHELKYGYTLPFADLNLAAKVGYQRSGDICLNQKDFLIGLNRNFSLPTGGKPIEGFNAGATYTGVFGEEQCSKDTFYYYTDDGDKTNTHMITFFIKRSW
jgi:uncharacterized protein (TIGR02001 family)